MNWLNAKHYCESLYHENFGYAHLIEIYNQTQQIFLKEKLLEINDKTLVWWIGLTDREKEGNWKSDNKQFVHHLG